MMPILSEACSRSAAVNPFACASKSARPKPFIKYATTITGKGGREAWMANAIQLTTDPERHTFQVNSGCEKSLKPFTGHD